MSDGRLAGRVALVTGASRGIGRAVAGRFAAEGATVICVARNRGGLEELDDEVAARNAPGRVVLTPLDLTDFESIEKVAFAVHQRFDHLDILVGNAGDLGGGLSPLGHYQPKLFRQAFDVNVTANYGLIRAFDPLLRRSDAGRAIFVTDSRARVPLPYWGAYAASKAALETLARTWAAEVGRTTNLRVNLVDPGVVRTRLRTEAFPGEDPLQHPPPEAVTDAFVDLASPECSRNGEIVRA